MDTSIVKNALGELEQEVEEAREARRQMETDETYGEHRGGWEEPDEVLELSLNSVYEILTVILEAAGMPDTRMRLIEKWRTFDKAGGLKKTDFDPRYNYLDSRPLAYVETLLSALRAITGEGASSSEAFDLARLETILRNTAVLVRKRGVTPQGELDVQRVMHDYLEAFFTEYHHPVNIPGAIKSFQPDGGIRNLKAAIEFKYAAAKDEVSRALSGIFEDISGYSGSHDWTRFYTVVYQTEPFESEDRFRSEMSRVGAVTWTPILVNWEGRKKKVTQRKAGKRLPAATKSPKLGPPV